MSHNHLLLQYTSRRVVLIHLGVFLLCDAFFLFDTWAIDPFGVIVAVLNEAFGVDFASTSFESSLALLKVGSVVLGANDGDEDDEGGYDTNEDTLNLMIKEFEIMTFELLKKGKGDIRLQGQVQ